MLWTISPEYNQLFRQQWRQEKTLLVVKEKSVVGIPTNTTMQCNWRIEITRTAPGFLSIFFWSISCQTETENVLASLNTWQKSCLFTITQMSHLLVISGLFLHSHQRQKHLENSAYFLFLSKQWSLACRAIKNYYCFFDDYRENFSLNRLQTTTFWREDKKNFWLSNEFSCSYI